MTVETIERTAYRKPPSIVELAPTREEPLAQETVSVVQIASPTEIFSQVKKTPLMLEVEKIIQGDLQVFLARKYSEEGLSTPDISQMITEISGGNIKVREQTINNWLRKFNSQVRSRSEAVKLAWLNPQKREGRIEGRHSRMRKRAKSKSLSEYWQSLSESEKENRLRPVREYNRTVMLRGIRETLGENPAERLNEMCWQEDLSSKEIGEKLGKSPSTVLEWMKFLEVRVRKRGGTAGETPHGYIKTNKEGKQNLVEEARARELVQNLDPKEQFVIYYRYPTDGIIQRHVEIGKRLYPKGAKINRQWPQALEKRALQKLQESVNSQPSGLLEAISKPNH